MTASVSLEDALDYGAKKLGMEFKDQQKRALRSFLLGHDVFVALPTGFGKSVIFQSATLCHEYMNTPRNSDTAGKPMEKSLALVVMPIKALILDQIEICKGLGISTADMSKSLTDELRHDICMGNISIIFTSPEFLTGESGRDFMRMEYVQAHLCGLFVDESHCVTKWGQSSGKSRAFRSSYGHLAELRSSLPKVPVVALTATATEEVRCQVAGALGLRNYDMVMESPDKSNVKHVFVKMRNQDFDETFHFLIEELVKSGKDCERVIIYCQSRKIVAELFALFISEAPEKYRDLIEMYHTNTESEVQAKILADFANPSGQIRILIATIAFGMGVDVKGCHSAIIVGRPTDLEDYIQMTGRIGRDGMASTAILLRYPGDAVGKKMMPGILNFCEGQICRRQAILKSFGVSSVQGQEIAKHLCCDICASQCAECPVPHIEELVCRSLQSTTLSSELPIRIPTPGQVDKLRMLLEECRDMLISDDPDHIYCGRDIASGLSQPTIDHIMRETNVSWSEAEFLNRYDFASYDVGEICWQLYMDAMGMRGEERQGCTQVDSQAPEDVSEESDQWSGDEFAALILEGIDSESD